MDNLSQLVTWIVAISVTVERLLELVFDMVEQLTSVKQFESKNSDGYAVAKRVLSTLLGPILGLSLTLIFASGLGIGADLPIRIRFLMGFVGGVLAPYSHLLISLLSQFKLFAAAQTDLAAATGITTTTTSVSPTAAPPTTTTITSTTPPSNSETINAATTAPAAPAAAENAATLTQPDVPAAPPDAATTITITAVPEPALASANGVQSGS